MNEILWTLIQMAPRPAEGGPPPSPFASLVPLLLIFAIFYFMLLRPQQKRARQMKEMIESLKVGDEILTTGGIFGRITRVGEKRLTIEIADKVKVQISKDHIARKEADSGDAPAAS